MSLQKLFLMILKPSSLTPSIDPAVIQQTRAVAAEALRAAQIRKLKYVVSAPAAHAG